MSKASLNHSNTYARNRRAEFDYEIHDEFVAGVVLAGHEAKSVRNGGADLKGSYVTFHDGEARLTNATIRKYKHASTIKDYDDTAPRKLLLKKHEIEYLSAQNDAGFSIIPLSIFRAGRYIKVKIGTAKSKKKHDKRHDIKKRDTKRDMAKDFKKFNIK